METGWIKLHRRVLTNPMFRRDHTAWMIFQWLLLSANRQGEVTTGRFVIADALGVKGSTVYSALRRMVREEMVVIESNNKYSVIRICNWSNYQGIDNSEVVTSVNNKATTKQQQDNTPLYRQERRIENTDEQLAALPPVEKIPKKGKSAYATAETLTPAELQRIADQKRVSVKDVEYVLEKVKGWPKAGTVKDWNLTVQSWIATEIRDGKIKERAAKAHVHEELNPYVEPLPVASTFDTDQIRRNLASKFSM